MKFNKLIAITSTILTIIAVTTIPFSFADHDEKDGSPRNSQPPTLGIKNDGEVMVQGGLSINGDTYQVRHSWQTIPTHTFNVGETIELKLKVYEDKGANELAHVAVYPNMDESATWHPGISFIVWEQDLLGNETVEVGSPDDLLDDVNVSSERINRHITELIFSFKITQPIEEKNIIVYSWDERRNGWKNYFIDAITVQDNTQKSSVNKPSLHKSIETQCDSDRVYVIKDGGNTEACIHPDHVKIWKKFGWEKPHN